MHLFEHTFRRIFKTEKLENLPTNYCPNCWGKQEYGGVLYEAIKVEGVNSFNMGQKKGWIRAYAEKYLVGIKENTQLVCNTCTVKYEVAN